MFLALFYVLMVKLQLPEVALFGNILNAVAIKRPVNQGLSKFL